MAFWLLESYLFLNNNALYVRWAFSDFSFYDTILHILFSANSPACYLVNSLYRLNWSNIFNSNKIVVSIHHPKIQHKCYELLYSTIKKWIAYTFYSISFLSKNCKFIYFFISWLTAVVFSNLEINSLYFIFFTFIFSIIYLIIAYRSLNV